MKLQTDLREFIALLNSMRVKYVIVGGHAVAFHGYPRYTGDMDFLIEPSPDNAKLIHGVLQQFGFSSLGLTPADFDHPDKVVQLGYPPNRIDIITSIDGASFEEIWASRVPGDMDGLPVSFINKELLLRNKRAAGRPQDIADVKNLTK